ncbi:MAG: hypothetical protein ACRD2P_02135, partial [Terriglobia bacterium]
SYCGLRSDGRGPATSIGRRTRACEDDCAGNLRGGMPAFPLSDQDMKVLISYLDSSEISQLLYLFLMG